MQLSKFAIAIIAAALSFGNAAPTGSESSPEERDIIYLDHAGYAWDEYDQKGQRWSLTTFGGCYRMWPRVPSNDRFSSVQIDEGIECRFYRNIFCDKNLIFESGVMTGRGPLARNIPPAWNNVVSSYRCYRVPPPE